MKSKPRWRNHGSKISHDHRIGGFNYLILERKTLRGSYTNKNAIIPPQRIKAEQCTRNGRERILEVLQQESWRTLWERIETLMNHHEGPPYTNEWCNVTKVEKNKIMTLPRFRWSPMKRYLTELDTPENKDKRLRKELISWATPEEELKSFDETRIRIMLCLSFIKLNWWQATDLAYHLFLLKGSWRDTEKSTIWSINEGSTGKNSQLNGNTTN